MTDRFFFLVNPVSGNGKVKKLWPSISEELKKKNIRFDFEETTCKEDGIRIAQKALLKNYKCYVSVGGDGIFHEMINGLLKNSPSIKPTVFILPIGTGNDFVRTHNIPEWSLAWLEKLNEFKTKEHNVGLIKYENNNQQKTRYFANVAGLFYDGYIVRATTLRRKPINSSIQYLGLIIKYLFKYVPPKGRIRWDKGYVVGAFYTANIGISKYSGGGMQFVPHADPFGKKLAVTLAKQMHPIRVLLSTPYFYNGKVEKHKKISCFYTNKITIDPVDEEILLEADGEFLGAAPCSIELIHAAFRLVV